ICGVTRAAPRVCWWQVPFCEPLTDCRESAPPLRSQGTGGPAHVPTDSGGRHGSAELLLREEAPRTQNSAVVLRARTLRVRPRVGAHRPPAARPDLIASGRLRP